MPPNLKFSEEAADALFQDVKQNLQAICESARQGLVANLGSDLHLALTWSISLDSDIAAGIVKIAEHGGEGQKAVELEPAI